MIYSWKYYCIRRYSNLKLWYCHSTLQTCSNLYSCLQWLQANFPTLNNVRFYQIIFIFSNINNKKYLIFICIILVTSDYKHIFICFWPISFDFFYMLFICSYRYIHFINLKKCFIIEKSTIFFYTLWISLFLTLFKIVFTSLKNLLFIFM